MLLRQVARNNANELTDRTAAVAGRISDALRDGTLDRALAQSVRPNITVDGRVAHAVTMLTPRYAPTPIGYIRTPPAQDRRAGHGPAAMIIHEVARLRRTLRAASGSGNLAELAAANGYSDQAHLCREARRFSGLTAHALMRCGSDRSGLSAEVRCGKR